MKLIYRLVLEEIRSGTLHPSLSRPRKTWNTPIYQGLEVIKQEGFKKINIVKKCKIQTFVQKTFKKCSNK